MAATVHVRDEATDSNDSSQDVDESIDARSGEESSQEDTPQISNLGMADVMAKILQKNLQPVVKDKKAKKRKRNTETAVGHSEDEDSSDDDVSSNPKKLWENLGREKVNPLDKDRERQLQRIATRGVVQLFNAVHKQQKIIEDKCREARTESQQEAVIKSMKKTKFLDLLNSTPAPTAEEAKWKVLQDDFLHGSSMKAWDRDSEED